jgi:hypothetical protein
MIMARMIKLFIFTIVITQLFIASGCGELGRYVHDAPGNAGDQKFLYQLIGQSRETVFAELGRPDLEITQNERQFLMYINIVDSTSYGAAIYIPFWGTSEDIAASCLRIELESNSLVKGFKIKKDMSGWYYPFYIRGCLRSFWSEKQLQQTYTQVDDYLELMIVDPISAARMLCENADDGYPLARYMLGSIYGHVGNNLANYVWWSLSGHNILDKEDWVEITGLDAKELDNALKEWQPGQCDPKIISKIITDNHEKFFGNSKNSFSATWKRAIWK